MSRLLGAQVSRRVPSAAWGSGDRMGKAWQAFGRAGCSDNVCGATLAVPWAGCLQYYTGRWPLVALQGGRPRGMWRRSAPDWLRLCEAALLASKSGRSSALARRATLGLTATHFAMAPARCEVKACRRHQGSCCDERDRMSRDGRTCALVRQADALACRSASPLCVCVLPIGC